MRAFSWFFWCYRVFRRFLVKGGQKHHKPQIALFFTQSPCRICFTQKKRQTTNPNTDTDFFDFPPSYFGAFLGNGTSKTRKKYFGIFVVDPVTFGPLTHSPRGFPKPNLAAPWGGDVRATTSEGPEKKKMAVAVPGGQGQMYSNSKCFFEILFVVIKQIANRR
jgi:hypothetical protein